MPVTLPPLTRRRFFGCIAGAAILSSAKSILAADPVTDPNRFFLLSDIHIDGDKTLIDRETNMYSNMEQVVSELVKEKTRAAAVLINGDCAHRSGNEADYKNLLTLLEPIRKNATPIHLTMGNHDQRDHFWGVIPDQDPARKALDGRQIAVLPSPKANFFLLDSLNETNQTPGLLGKKQLDWLAKSLDERKDKPAIVMVHHNPNNATKVTGLEDTKDLLDTILPRKHVKMLVFGHTHDWNNTQQDGVHFVNLPPVAYLFAPGKPNGWVDCHLKDNGITLQLRCLDQKHPQHLQELNLDWR